MNEDLEVLLIQYTYNGARGSRHVGRLNTYYDEKRKRRKVKKYTEGFE